MKPEQSGWILFRRSNHRAQTRAQQFRLRVGWVVSSLLLVLLSGCAWTDEHGTHHLIVGIGFGVVTTTNGCGVSVEDSRVLGVEAGATGVGVGWISRHRVAINPDLASNTVVSVTANPLGLTVKNFDPYSTNTAKIINAQE